MIDPAAEREYIDQQTRVQYPDSRVAVYSRFLKLVDEIERLYALARDTNQPTKEATGG